MFTKKQKVLHAAIFVMIIVFSVSAVNYHVDSYAQVRISYLDIAEKMADGYNVTGLAESRYNERYLALAVMKQMKEAPELILLGSSRSMIYGKEDFDVESFYNFSLSGGTLKDYYGIVGYLAHEKLLPEKVVIEVGGPLFYEGDTELRYTYLQSGIDYLNAVMEGESADCRFPALGKQYHKLLAIDYFKYNLACLYEQARFAVDYTKAADNLQSTKMTDGSITYSEAVKARSTEYVVNATNQAIDSRNLYKIEGYTAMSRDRVTSFERLVGWLTGQGVEVVLFIPPYSEPIYEYMRDNKEEYAGVFATEEYIVGFAEEKQLTLYGSYSPEGCGLQLEDLYDAYHVRREADIKVFYER